MHAASSHADQHPQSLARFGFSHGYRLEGDSALLNAQIDLDPSAARTAESFALQLWACEEPYRGGPLKGFKIAEAPIALPELAGESQLDTVAFAHPPAAALTRVSEARDGASREFSMVLVLAAGSPGAFDQVHDFANYPARERFVVPHLEGAAGYKLHEDGRVSVHVDRVVNPRATDNLSGSLSLQLWASDQPYAGGSLSGTLLASHELGQVRGQDALTFGEELRSTLAQPLPAPSHLALALCEWTALGYLVRDYCAFSEPYRAEPANRPPADARRSLGALSEQELAQLSGLSLKLAAQILKGRPYKSLDELRAVRGIGDKTVSKLRKLLTV